MSKLTFGSLFAGIGGFDLGFERAGMQCKWQVEIDPYCQRVLAKHWPDVRRLGDVRQCGKHNLHLVDWICGGPPCQPASQAGLRRGESDERWLWGEALRIIRDLRPAGAVLEDPTGLLSLDGGRAFGRIIHALDKSGFDAQWECLPTSAFGAPFEGDRLFICATDCSRFKGKDMHEFFREKPKPGTWWLSEPGVRRVADGVSSTVGRGGGNIEVACLANAVVPQVAEWIGRRIVEATTPPTHQSAEGET